jgi:hypothetical protein
MMSFLTYITRFFMNFELLQILTDYAKSYVKLSSAVAAILVGGLKCRTQFWKGTTQGSFQQSLVEIESLDGSLPKMCLAVRPFDQDCPQSRT